MSEDSIMLSSDNGRFAVLTIIVSAENMPLSDDSILLAQKICYNLKIVYC